MERYYCMNGMKDKKRIEENENQVLFHLSKWRSMMKQKTLLWWK